MKYIHLFAERAKVDSREQLFTIFADNRRSCTRVCASENVNARGEKIREKCQNHEFAEEKRDPIRSRLFVCLFIYIYVFSSIF